MKSGDRKHDQVLSWSYKLNKTYLVICFSRIANCLKEAEWFWREWKSGVDGINMLILIISRKNCDSKHDQVYRDHIHRLNKSWKSDLCPIFVWFSHTVWKPTAWVAVENPKYWQKFVI